MKTGPLASVQVKAHSRNHRLEVKLRRAGSAVVLETTQREAAELRLSLSPTAAESTLQHADLPLSTLTSFYATVARLHFG